METLLIDDTIKFQDKDEKFDIRLIMYDLNNIKKLYETLEQKVAQLELKNLSLEKKNSQLENKVFQIETLVCKLEIEYLELKKNSSDICNTPENIDHNFIESEEIHKTHNYNCIYYIHTIL